MGKFFQKIWNKRRKVRLREKPFLAKNENKQISVEMVFSRIAE